MNHGEERNGRIQGRSEDRRLSSGQLSPWEQKRFGHAAYVYACRFAHRFKFLLHDLWKIWTGKKHGRSRGMQSASRPIWWAVLNGSSPLVSRLAFSLWDIFISIIMKALCICTGVEQRGKAGLPLEGRWISIHTHRNHPLDAEKGRIDAGGNMTNLEPRDLTNFLAELLERKMKRETRRDSGSVESDVSLFVERSFGERLTKWVWFFYQSTGFF